MPESCCVVSAGCAEVVKEILSGNIEMVMGVVLGVGLWQMVGVGVACCLARNRQAMEERGAVSI